MNPTRSLQVLLRETARTFPEKTAITDPGSGSLSYRGLDEVSDQLRDRLVQVGVRPGDRVGLYLHKSAESIIGIFGVLKAGAAYVPVDPDAPVARCAYILNDCSVRLVVTEESLVGALRTELSRLGSAPAIIALPDQGPDRLSKYLHNQQQVEPAPSVETVQNAPADLAYILYTSGSTGSPKGVMLTHEAALCFVDWCSDTFRPTAEDVFSSHAPLHFDLSIHDVFVSLKHGGRLVLIGEQLGKDPGRLAELISDERISIWYSTPSILNLLATFGKLDRYDYGSLRIVLFAGEVFPVAQLRAVKSYWPSARFFNLYGPTETNVCTWFEIPEHIPADRNEPFPIGRMCPPLRGRVVDEAGEDIRAGGVGELVVSGPGVMSGYWNLPDRNAVAFLTDGAGVRWYRTGDLVVEIEGVYLFHGRRDRMVKRRGYRIELGEIEAGLSSHPDVREVAVVAFEDQDGAVSINAFLQVSGDGKPSVIAFKQFSATHLPRYMTPDVFTFVDALPRTSTDKIDYQTLKARLQTSVAIPV